MNALLLLLLIVVLLQGAAHDEQKISGEVKTLFEQINPDQVSLEMLEGKPDVRNKALELVNNIHMKTGYTELSAAVSKAHTLKKHPAFCMKKLHALNTFTDGMLCKRLKKKNISFKRHERVITISKPSELTEVQEKTFDAVKLAWAYLQQEQCAQHYEAWRLGVDKDRVNLVECAEPVHAAWQETIKSKLKGLTEPELASDLGSFILAMDSRDLLGSEQMKIDCNSFYSQFTQDKDFNYLESKLYFSRTMEKSSKFKRTYGLQQGTVLCDHYMFKELGKNSGLIMPSKTDTLGEFIHLNIDKNLSEEERMRVRVALLSSIIFLQKQFQGDPQSLCKMIKNMHRQPVGVKALPSKPFKISGYINRWFIEDACNEMKQVKETALNSPIRLFLQKLIDENDLKTLAEDPEILATAWRYYRIAQRDEYVKEERFLPCGSSASFVRFCLSCTKSEIEKDFTNITVEHTFDQLVNKNEAAVIDDNNARHLKALFLCRAMLLQCAPRCGHRLRLLNEKHAIFVSTHPELGGCGVS